MSARRVGLTYNLRETFPRREGQPSDADGDWDVPETVHRLLEGLRNCGCSVLDVGDPRHLANADVRGQIELVFNICEMVGFRSREGLVPSLCEVLNLPYLLSPPDTLMISLDKNLCNYLVRQAGAPVPDWHVVHSLDHLRLLGPKCFDFPCLVKPVAEGSGMGIDADSVALCPETLQVAVARVIENYRQPALVQAWLEGREFTIGLLERGKAVTALKALEIRPRQQPEHFVYGFATKERADALVDFVPLDEPELERGLADIAVIAFRAIGCRDGARVDLRLSGRRPYFLEINPLPHFHPDVGDFCRSARAAGLEYSDLLARLVENGATRWGL